MEVAAGKFSGEQVVESVPEHGGTYIVKVNVSEKEATEDGGWRHTRIRLKPDSTDPSLEPIVLEVEGLEEEELKIVAEMVEVLA